MIICSDHSSQTISRMITLHSLETAAKPSIQKTMVLSFSCAAVSRASRQALNSDSCKSPNTQWKMPSEEKRDGEEGGERRGVKRNEGKKLTINKCNWRREGKGKRIKGSMQNSFRNGQKEKRSRKEWKRKGKGREIATTNCSQSYLLKGIKGTHAC